MPVQTFSSNGNRVDARSYHVFEFRGTKLLFDRATGATVELNSLSFDVLTALKSNAWTNVSKLILENYPGVNLDDVVLALDTMYQRGFFRFKNIGASDQDEQLELLWNHPPRRIQMLMAQGCNLGCRYCYAWRNGSNQKHTLMPWSVARQTVDYLVWRSGARRDLQITFFGGEPLLNWDTIKQVVEYGRTLEKSHGKRFLFELITNGTLLDREKTDWIARERFLLFISIDGWREMHNYNRPSLNKRDEYDEIVDNAQYANKKYRELGLPLPKIRANLTNKYHDHVAEGHHLESLGFSVIGVGPIEPLPHGDPSPSALSEDQSDEMSAAQDQLMADCLDKLGKNERLGPFLGSQFNKQTLPPEPRTTLGVTCGIGRNTVVVDNRGNMFPCHRYEGMDAFVLGNVFTGMDRDRMMKYYKKVNRHALENCHECWIRDYCGGGCAWLLSTIDGNIVDPTDRECNRRRHAMERTLWLRSELRRRFPERMNKEGELALEKWTWESVTGESRKRSLALKVLSENTGPKKCGC